MKVGSDIRDSAIRAAMADMVNAAGGLKQSGHQPRHLVPQPKVPIISPRAGLEGVVDSPLFAQHAIEMFRRSLPDGLSDIASTGCEIR
jgi:hypothetical protein